MPRSGVKAALLSGVFCPALLACAPQTKMAVPTPDAVAKETAVQQDLMRGGFTALPKTGERVSGDPEVRTFAVGNRVLIGGADICGKNVRTVMPFGVKADEAGAFRVLWAVDKDGTGQAPRFDDVLVALDGQPLLTGRRAGRDLAARMTAAAQQNRAVALRVDRAGQILELTVAPTASCDYYIEYDNRNVENAYADGKAIHVYRGLIRILGDDHELAAVIAHELAHNALGHLRSANTNLLIGVLLGGLLGALADGGTVDEGTGPEADDDAFDFGPKAKAQNSGGTGDGTQVGPVTSMMAQMGGAVARQFNSAFEAEADYVGAYIMAAAGFDYEAMPDVLRRLAQPKDFEFVWGRSHPPTPERAAAAEATIDEIRRKIAAGQPLRPEVKTKPVPAKPASDKR
jgi:Zn-dependent protease with chaperone function